MEKSSQPSFLRSLALAFGDGLLFGVAMRLAQGPSKTREDEMTDLGPLAERLRKVEDHTQTIDKEALAKFGEGLDGRVLEKVIVALEARLTEHVGQVDRRLAEIDAQVALDLKAVDTHTASQTNAVERAIQQIEAQVREYVAEAQQASAEQISGVDQRLSALQEALPAKFREIIEAVRQSMEARVTLELTELESRVSSRSIDPEKLQELQTNLRGEIEALSGRLSTEMHGLSEGQQSQIAPLQQALQQLETKLTTLREELPPKIRQIVQAVEASMDARISAGDQQAAGRADILEQALAALRAEVPSAAGFQQVVDENLRRHAEEVGALDHKLTVLQEELPPKIKAIVDAVRESLDARVALELEEMEKRHSAQAQQSEARFNEAQEQFRQQLAAASKTPALELSVAKVQADVASLEQHAAQMSAGVAAELESVKARHRADIEQLEGRLLAQRAAENIPAQINSAVAGLRDSLEAKLAADIHDLEARTPDRAPDLEKALQYASLLEARVQALEQKLQRSAEETVDRAVERVWQALESRLQQREAHALQGAGQPALETITGLRQKSTSAEQSVMDLIAGIGQLFEKPAPRVVRGTAPTIAQLHAVSEPASAAPLQAAHAEPAAAEHIEPEPPVTAHSEPEPPIAADAGPGGPAASHGSPAPKSEPEGKSEAGPEAPVTAKPELAAKAPEPGEPPPAPPAQPEPAAAPVAAATAVEEEAGEDIMEPKLEEKPPVILFRPKDSGRKWRIPFVSSFLLMAAAIAWLQFM
jgi:hypothetical protein